jgi:hypothetical protein
MLYVCSLNVKKEKKVAACHQTFKKRTYVGQSKNLKPKFSCFDPWNLSVCSYAEDIKGIMEQNFKKEHFYHINAAVHKKFIRPRKKLKNFKRRFPPGFINYK